MSDMDRMQEINVDFSQFIKKNLKKIKMLPKDKQKEFGRLLGDFKDGLDDLSEGTYESVVTEAVKEVVLSNEILNFLEARGVIKASDSQKIHKDLTAFLKKNLNESVNEAKIAFVNDKLVGDRIQKSGLLPLLGDNNVSLNPNKVKFTRELRDTLVKLYKKYSSLTVK
jgi:hypothetical protein